MATLLYLHGFNSSPQSAKAQQTRDWLETRAADVGFRCPTLSPFADQAIDLLEDALGELLPVDSVWLMGSSMGGYFATWLAEKYHLPAVLINPAVRPYLGMRDYLGENRNFHTGKPYIFLPEHIEQYRKYDVESLQLPENFLVLLQTGDEVLDYRLAEDKYRDNELVVELGGDHSFQGYARHLPDILKFFRQF